MKKNIWFWIMCLVHSTLMSQSASTDRRVALVVGNSKYKLDPLTNPTNDARKMKETLENMGFEVTLVLNSSEKELRAAIATFGQLLGSDKGMVGLFYFAGHGIQANGKNYLVPVDATINSEADYDINCVDIDLLNGYLEKAENQFNILILDACRNNPYAKKTRSIGKSGGNFTISAPAGTMIAFATAPDKTASDGQQDNGLYTQELIKAMKTPNIKIEDVFKQVRIQVKKISQDQQIPWESSSIVGDFYFVRNNNQPPPIKPSTDPEPIATSNTANLGLVFINSRSYKMGSINRPFNEQPVHEVSIDNFWIAKYEVTIKDWQNYCVAIDKAMPYIEDVEFDDTYWGKRQDHPITNITWLEACEYANWLSQKKGLSKVYQIAESTVTWDPSANGYRLPTEAEWEMAARSPYTDYPYAGSNYEQEVSWSNSNSEDHTHTVGLKKPNEAMLFDMSGNVWEWCWDWYDEYYYKISTKYNPAGINVGAMKAIRGGSWLSVDNRVTLRRGRSPKTKSTEIGFRLVKQK